MKRRVSSHYTLIDGKLERNIVVEVDDTGLITNIIHSENIDAMASVEFYPGILIPGMINAHCHLELSYLRAAISEGGGYATFAREIGRVRGNFSNEERIHAASVSDAAMWEQGIEAVADIANDNLVMQVKERSKIEYHTMFEFFGLNNSDVQSHEDLAHRYTNAGVTPHSIYSVQDKPFKHICQAFSDKLSIHFMESDDESALYHKQGSLWEWYERMGWECDFLGYGSPARRIAESLAPNSKVMLVHATRVTAEDVKTIDTALPGSVTWVLCPESNRYISRFCPPYKMLSDMEAQIAIGTDSLASARELSMIDNMRLLEDIALEKLLTWATLNGAKALGIEDRKGSIEVGKRPGLVVIEGADLASMKLTAESVSHRII